MFDVGFILQNQEPHRHQPKNRTYKIQTASS